MKTRKAWNSMKIHKMWKVARWALKCTLAARLHKLRPRDERDKMCQKGHRKYLGPQCLSLCLWYLFSACLFHMPIGIIQGTETIPATEEDWLMNCLRKQSLLSTLGPDNISQPEQGMQGQLVSFSVLSERSQWLKETPHDWKSLISHLYSWRERRIQEISDRSA